MIVSIKKIVEKNSILFQMYREFLYNKPEIDTVIMPGCYRTVKQMKKLTYHIYSKMNRNKHN